MKTTAYIDARLENNDQLFNEDSITNLSLQHFLITQSRNHYHTTDSFFQQNHKFNAFIYSYIEIPRT